MKRKVRFTLVFDRCARTAVAALIASLDAAARDDYARVIRTVPQERLQEVDFDPALREFVCMSSMTRNFAQRAESHEALRMKHGRAYESIIGGPHASADPRGALSAGFDYCCVGEGEEVVRHIYDRAVSGLPLEEVSGVLTLREGRPAGELRHSTIGLDGFDPLPRRIRFPTYIEVGRGCRWGCAYCQTPRIFGHTERFRSPERVAEIASLYSRWGMKDIRLLLPNALAYGSTQPGIPDCGALDELLGRVRSSCGGAKIYLGSFPSEVRPDYVTPEAVAILKKHVANDNLVIGGQSGSDRVLGWLGRGHGVEDIRRAARVVASGGFRPSVDLMLGFPIEGAADREATFGLAQELGRGQVRVNMHFLIPLPGTPLEGCQPRFLTGDERRKLDRLAQQGIVRGSWRRQEEIARSWLDREEKNPSK
jgi:B12-binding domain/radical SAM domain protein